MFRKTFLAASLALLAAPAATASPDKAFDLMVGDKAPALDVGGWIKGEVPSFQQGKVYVVEFWATWCGPCRKAIPHMSDLAEQYAPQNVEFVGISIWEQDPGPEQAEAETAHGRVQEIVKSFVDTMGDKMSYTVGYDSVPTAEQGGYNGSYGSMARNWMFAAGQQGIPTAFIVNREGTIAWIGSPFGIDDPLDAIVNGEWDLAAAVKAHEKEMKPRAQEFRLRSSFEEAMGTEDPEAAKAKAIEALGVLDAAVAENPDLERNWGVQKMLLLVKADRTDDAYAYGNTLVDGALKDNVGGLNYIAWLIVNPDAPLDKRDVDLALRASKRSNELTEWDDPALLDTYAAAHFMKGDVAQAVKWQKEAVKFAKGTPYEQDILSRLEKYEAAQAEAKG